MDIQHNGKITQTLSNPHLTFQLPFFVLKSLICHWPLPITHPKVNRLLWHIDIVPIHQRTINQTGRHFINSCPVRSRCSHAVSLTSSNRLAELNQVPCGAEKVLLFWHKVFKLCAVSPRKCWRNVRHSLKLTNTWNKVMKLLVRHQQYNYYHSFCVHVWQWILYWFFINLTFHFNRNKKNLLF